MTSASMGRTSVSFGKLGASNFTRTLAAAFLSLAPAAAQTFSLRGYLVDGLTNRPISGAGLHLYSTIGGNPGGGHRPARAPAGLPPHKRRGVTPRAPAARPP